MSLFTIGFTKKKAKEFFELLKGENIKTLIDIRLNNVSQLAGFAKKDDLKYFLKELCDIDYIHVPQMSPTKEILDAYKKKEMHWDEYEKNFKKIMQDRNVEKIFDHYQLDSSCLLCSEHEATYCHRRLVAEYLKEKNRPNLIIEHLG